jgi:hypothetical protein
MATYALQVGFGPAKRPCTYPYNWFPVWLMKYYVFIEKVQENPQTNKAALVKEQT